MKRILLDPGHEKKEPGSTQADGESEVSFTVPVCQLTRAELQAGWECEVFLTHEGEGVVPSRDLVVELEARSRMADLLQADFLLSVHHNAGPKTARGAEYYIHTRLRSYGDLVTRNYPPDAGELVWLDAEVRGQDGTPNHDAPRSLAFAQVMVPILAETLAAQGIPWRGRSGRIMASDFAVLRYCSVPCGLIETHFGTNPEEDAIADTPEFRQALAKSIAFALATALQLPRKAAAYPPNYVRVVLPSDAGLQEIAGELREGTTWITIPGTAIEAPVRAMALAMGRRIRWEPTPAPPTAYVE